MMRRGCAIGTMTAVLVLASCGSHASPPHTGAGGVTPVSSSTTPSAALDPLTGTWRSTFTCDDVAKALERARLQKYNAQVLRPDNLGHCDEVMHITYMFSDGALSISGIIGKTDSPTPYQIVNDHRYVQGFLQNSYRIQGNRLIFTDTKIIAALYPYDPKIMLREHAFDVGALMAAPFLRVS